MSITKRLMDLAKSNLTDFRSAFDRDELRDLLSRKKQEPPEEPEEVVEDESAESVGSKAGRRARKFKDAAEEAWDRAYESARTRAGVHGMPRDAASDRRRWYKTLELDPGADLKQVRKAYRRLLGRYHPDRFAMDPEKFRAATEVTRKLTEAYNGLNRHLGG